MNTVTLESVLEIANNGRTLQPASIYFGRVGHGTKTHIVRKLETMTATIYTLCGAERVSTMSNRRPTAYTIKETEVPASTLCGRCMRYEKAAG